MWFSGTPVANLVDVVGDEGNKVSDRNHTVMAVVEKIAEVVVRNASANCPMPTHHHDTTSDLYFILFHDHPWTSLSGEMSISPPSPHRCVAKSKFFGAPLHLSPCVAG